MRDFSDVKSPSRTPWPDVWRRPSLSMALPAVAMVVVSGFTLFLVIGAAELFVSETPTATGLLALSGFLLTVVVLLFKVLLLRGRATERNIKLVLDKGGVLFHYSKLWHYSSLVLTLELFFASTAGLGVGLIEVLEAPSFAEGLPGWLILLLSSGSMVLFLWVLRRITRGRSNHGVVLSPEGIGCRDNTGTERFVSWDKILGVRPDLLHVPMYSIGVSFVPTIVAFTRSGNAGPIHFRDEQGIWRKAEREIESPSGLEIPGHTLAMNPAVLYYAMLFYHTYPEARVELSTHSGLQRILSGNLLTHTHLPDALDR